MYFKQRTKLLVQKAKRDPKSYMGLERMLLHWISVMVFLKNILSSFVSFLFQAFVVTTSLSFSLIGTTAATVFQVQEECRKLKIDVFC